MHMVKAIMLELQPKAESEGPARMAIDASSSGTGQGNCGDPVVKGKDTHPISVPEQPQIYGGKG